MLAGIAAADGTLHSSQRRSRGQIFVEEIAASGSAGGIVAFPDSVQGQ
jgi:hypothetical protein